MKPSPLETRLARGAILAGAVTVFARLGFASTRVEDILAAAGIARRTFYKYFDGKEAVLAAIYEVATDELLTEMRSAATALGDPLDAIRRGLDVYLDYHVENAALVRMLVEHAIRSDSPLHPARQRFRQELVRLIGQAVRATTGEKQDALLYAALVSAMEGVSLDLLASAGARGVSTAAIGRAKRVMHTILTRVLAPS